MSTLVEGHSAYVVIEHFADEEDQSPCWAITCSCTWIEDVAYSSGSPSARDIAYQMAESISAHHLKEKHT